MRRIAFAIALLWSACAWAQHSNPQVGDVWLYFGPTLGAGWGDNPTTSNLPNNTVLGNVSGVAAPATALTATQATTLCNTFTSLLKGCVPASGGDAGTYLNGAGGFTTPAGTGITQLTGDVTAGPGSGSVASTLANTAVTPGSYTTANITVDSKGRLTAAANGAGSGGTDCGTGIAGQVCNSTGGTTAVWGQSIIAPDGSGAGAGTAVTLTAGTGGATGAGGALNLTTGTGGATSGNAGSVNLITGSSPTNGNGGHFFVTTGSGSNNGIGGVLEWATGNGSGTGQGGYFQLYLGNGGETGTGGEFQVFAGAGGNTSGSGGAVSLTAGSATTQGNGGDVTVRTGAKAGTTVAGGILSLLGGSVALIADDANATTNAGGPITIAAGAGSSAAGGAIIISAGSASGGNNNGGTLNLAAGDASGAGTPGYVRVRSRFVVGDVTGALNAGETLMGKIAASGTAPGAGTAKFAWVAGTNAGSCKLISYAGTSTTPVTIVDNVGTGC